MSKFRVLVVEDDIDLRDALCDTLMIAGYHVFQADDGNTALEVLGHETVDIVISDVQMKQMDGHTLLKQVKTRNPELPFLLMTAYGTIEKAVQAMHDGAADYLVKPFEAEVLVNMVERFVAVNKEYDDYIAIDDKSIELRNLASRVAKSNATVMITGESGTGKEVLARFIHNESERADRPFVAINCAAIPENMLEATLFGYEKGAFTGAYKASPGKFELANGGTLLLDEISEMDLGLQAKILRVLQEKEVERLGGNKLIDLDVRILATSNRVMQQEVREGKFREDLFYRLNVFPLAISPLRERKHDIVPIASKIIAVSEHSNISISRDAEKQLLAHDWPGNVRELDNAVQRALILCDGQSLKAEDIVFEHLEPVTRPAAVVTPAAVVESQSASDTLQDDVKKHEQHMILDVLKNCMGNRKEAAERLGISPRTLRYKLARLKEAGIAIP
jgi:two-component system response regulator FlrC